MKKSLLAKAVAVVLVAASLAGCGNSKTDTNQADKTENTAENTTSQAPEVKKEDLKGTITLYTSQPEEDAQKLIDGFHEECPNIEVEVFRSGTEEVVSKVLAEKQADSVLADVLLVADSVTFESLKEQDLMMSYESPELKGIPEEFIDKDHMYTGTKVISTGIIYNTDMVSEAPKGFADLAKDTFKDNTIMPSPLYSGAAAYNLGVMTRNDALAKAFVDYVLSDKGQELAASIGYTPIKEGVKAPEGLKSISELKTMTYDISELYKARETDKEQFSSLFQ